MVHALLTLVLIVIFRKMLSSLAFVRIHRKCIEHLLQSPYWKFLQYFLWIYRIILIKTVVLIIIWSWCQCCPRGRGQVVRRLRSPDCCGWTLTCLWCGHPDYKTYSHGSLLESQSSPTQGAETRYDTWYIKFNHGLGTVIFHDLLQKRDLLCPENIFLKSLLQKERYMYLFIYCLERQVIY